MIKFSGDTLVFETVGPIAYLTLNRPERMNALTPEMREGLSSLADIFEKDDALRVLVVTGAGDKAFCAGADLQDTIPAMAGAAKDEKKIFNDPLKRMFSDVRKPIIAAVNGVCVAGGTELMLGTDLRIAAESASFGLPEPRWGLMAAGGSHIRLPRQIPYCYAMELLLTGRRISAREALAFSLINKVVPQEFLMEECEKLAKQICRNAPLAVRAIKETVLAGRNLSWEEGFFLENMIAMKIFASEDAEEGPKAFAEKRLPNYVGR